MFMVIAYDIRDDARRLSVARELERWGHRTQFSVFECDLDARESEMLLSNLRKLCIDEDALRVYKLCAGCVGLSEVIGGKGLATDADFYQV